MPKRYTFLSIGLVIVATALVAAQTDPASDWSALTTKLEKAALADDASGVKDARMACLRLLSVSPSSDRAALLRYTIAYAGWRLAFARQLPPKEQDDLLADAETQLTDAIKATPDFAEAYGLLSVVHAIQIAKNPDLGRSLGPTSAGEMEHALILEPDSPRLVMLHAQTRFNTPPEYGGSVKDAEILFRRALQLFDHDPAAKPWPNWGRFDAHVWLGQALAKRGDVAGARVEYDAALKIAPDSAWIKSVLIPGLTK